MFTTMNLHNLFHFVSLRLHPHAQHEIMVYADAMMTLIEPFVPISVKAYNDIVPEEIPAYFDTADLLTY